MVLGVVIGLAAGLAIGLAWHMARLARAAGAARLAEGRLADAQAQSAALAAQLRTASEAAAAAETARAVAVSQLDLLRTSEIEAARRAAQERDLLAGAFSELSAQALAKNNEQFLTLADSKLNEVRTATQGDLSQRQQAIAQLLDPLSETLARYERGLRDMEVERKGAYATLNERVAALHLGHEQLQKETRNLVTALRSPQTRGRWGEMTLRNAVKAAGMAEHCDFDEQRSTTTADGLLRPDMIVHLPGGGQVVIDSKVPLDAFLHFTEAEDEDERKAFLKKHANQLRTHVDQLAKKEYWRQFERSPEFVVAFIPGESLLAAACEADPGLQDHALGKGIVLATPNTLVAALKTIALSWQQETLAENAREVRELGAELYERLRVMTGHMQSLQRSLTSKCGGLQQGRRLLRVRVCSSPPASSPPSASWGCSPARSTSWPRSRRRPDTCRPTSPTCTTTSRGNRPSWRCPRAGPTPARRSPHTASQQEACRAGRPRTPPTYSAGVLHVHRSDRTDTLVSMLAELVAEPLQDPMTPEVVSVPTKGIERWLSQRLSARLGVTPGAHDGVCANIAFPFPGTLVSGALARATGNDPKADPWMPERSVWPLMEVVEQHFDEPWLAPLADHIRNAGATPDEDAAGTPRRPSVSPSSGTSRTSSIATPCTGPTWCSAGPRAPACPMRQPGKSSSGGACAPASTGRARRSTSRTPAPSSAKSPTCWTCRTGSRCSA